MKRDAIINPPQFTGLRHKVTEEIHLFRVSVAHAVSSTSVCERMLSSEQDGVPFSMFDEDEARMECAILGKKVCGTCVATLYATLPQPAPRGTR